MTSENIRELLNARPFRAFTVYMPSGQAVPVPARDFAAISPTGRTFVVLGDNESEIVLDVMLIERAEVSPASKRDSSD